MKRSIIQARVGLKIKKDQALAIRAMLKRMSSDTTNMAAELRPEELGMDLIDMLTVQVDAYLANFPASRPLKLLGSRVPSQIQ